MNYDYNQLFAKEYSATPASDTVRRKPFARWRDAASPLGEPMLFWESMRWNSVPNPFSSGTRIPITVKSESVRPSRPANPRGFRLSMG